MLGAFNNVVGTSFFPRYLEPFAPERIVEVGPGPKRLLSDPDVEDAEASVLKIRGTNECGRGVEGSGFVYADDRVMTNAHVVAGVDDPEVIIGDSSVSAEVVYYNPDLDVAVLAVDTSATARRCAFDQTAGRRGRRRDPGLPAGRAVRRAARPDPRRAAAALARTSTARAPSSARCSRCAGWSGPATPAARSCRRRGDVVGVVFAASVTDRDTGYALTADQVARSAARGVDQRRRGLDRRLRRLARSRALALAAQRLRDLLALADRRLGRAHLLDLADADEDQQRGEQQVEPEDDQERPVQGEALAVPVDEVGDRDRQHDDREHQR